MVSLCFLDIYLKKMINSPKINALKCNKDESFIQWECGHKSKRCPRYNLGRVLSEEIKYNKMLVVKWSLTHKKMSEIGYPQITWKPQCVSPILLQSYHTRDFSVTFLEISGNLINWTINSCQFGPSTVPLLLISKDLPLLKICLKLLP